MDFSSFRIDLGASFPAWVEYLRGIVTEPRALFWWPTLAAALVGALALYLPARRLADRAAGQGPGTASRRRQFLRELPVDALCVLGYTYTLVLIGPLLVGATVVGTALVIYVTGFPLPAARPAGFTDQLIMAALAFFFSDLFLYWSHRIFHLVKPLWRLHVLHHRPPVLTPLTAFRFWPPEAACHFIAFSLGEGIGFGVAARLLGTGVTPAVFAGVNVFLIAWYLAFSHLRHSHVPLYFPRWLSHVLISPQMHQVHHSIDARHHQRNFGTALALWDWMFGTLFIPARDNRFRFGVAAGEGEGRR